MSRSLVKWTLGLATFSLVTGGASLGVAQEKVVAEDAATDSKEAEESEVLTIGSKAPSIDVEHWVSDGHGKFKPVEKFKDGNVYIVEFWATWCGPCIASMPHLAETQEQYADKGVQIISISDEDLETVEGFLKRPVRGAKKPKTAAAEADEKDAAEPQSYGELTSAYCLTTDPDGSVKADYMEAAGQNGIPTCFIVGKTGFIEWIGHPMAMDKTLEAVVAGTWDRDVYLKQFQAEQKRDLLMTKLRRMLQRGDTEEAIEMVSEALESAEETEKAVYQQLKFQIVASAALQKIQGGEVQEGLEELDELAKSSTPDQKKQLTMVKFNVLIRGENYEEATEALAQIADAEDTSPETLNQISWNVYEAAKDNEDFSKTLLEAATAAAEKAMAGDPRNGMIIDTLAHLIYLQGDLERAIELQTEAVKNSGAAPERAQDDMKSFLEKLNEEKADK